MATLQRNPDKMADFGRPSRMQTGREGGAATAGLLDSPTLVLARRHSCLCHRSRQKGLPATLVALHTAPQPASGGSLDSMESERVSKPVFLYGTGADDTPSREHENLGIGSSCVCHGVLVGNEGV